MGYVIDKDMIDAIKYVEEDMNIHIDSCGTEMLLLALLKKDDSLLNCLCKLSYEELKDYLFEYNIYSDNKSINIIQKADEISQKDSEEFITDEHMLYSILKDGNNNAIDALEYFKINTNLMLITVEEYLELNDESYLINLTQEVKNNKIYPFIGKKNYIDKVIRILYKKRKNNCMLIGMAGVGKSALVEGVAKELYEKGCEENIYKLEIGALVAGTRYRGDLEERIMNVISKIKEKKAILFIDEIHMVTGGYKNDESLSIGNILKPILSRDGIKCIGATTTDEYYEYIDKDKAFSRRFQNLFLPEPTKEETYKILKEIKYSFEKEYLCHYSPKIIKEIIDYGIMFPNRCYPDKAIDILDEVGAYSKTNNVNINTNIIKRIVLENLGLGIDTKSIDSKYKEINQMFENYLSLDISKNIIGLVKVYNESEIKQIVKELENKFGITYNCRIDLDLEFFDDYMYSYMINSVLKNPICIIVVNNYQLSSDFNKHRIDNIINSGLLYDNKSRKISFRNCIFILNLNAKGNTIGYKNNEKQYQTTFDIT